MNARKCLARKTKHAFSKFFAEPTVFPEVQTVSYFDWQIIKDHG